MNIPNLLTLSRFFLTCFFVVYAHSESLASAYLAFVIFMFASMTDWADGFIARKYNLTSAFGKIMDPIADKFLVLAAFFVFALENIVPLWMVFVIAAREILVTSSRIHAMTNGQIIPAEKSGKIKTVFQMIAIVVILIYRILATGPATSDWTNSHEIFWQIGLNLLMIVAVALTLISGISYFQSLKALRQ